jgi:hypothetical protein
MWDRVLHWMSQATLWDWIWHIVAVVITLYLSVPGLWWPQFEKYVLKRNKETSMGSQSTDSLSTESK